jgi:hypothetical protein
MLDRIEGVEIHFQSEVVLVKFQREGVLVKWISWLSRSDDGGEGKSVRRKGDDARGRKGRGGHEYLAAIPHTPSHASYTDDRHASHLSGL